MRGSVIVAALALVACKAPTEQHAVTVDVQFLIAGAPPEYMDEAIGGPLARALENVNQGRRVRVVNQLGRVDLEVRFDRELPAKAYALVKTMVEIQGHKDGSIYGVLAEAPTYVMGTYETPPDLVVTVGGTGAIDVRAAEARSTVLPVLRGAPGVARVLARGAAPTHFAIGVNRVALAASRLSVVDVVATLQMAAPVTTPDALDALGELVVTHEDRHVKLSSVAGISLVPGSPEGPVELAVWLAPEGTAGDVETALSTAGAAFQAKGLVVTAGRAPGRSPPKPGDIEVSIMPEHGAATDVGWGRITADLTTAKLVGKLVQQPVGASPRAYSLKADLPQAARRRLAALTGFVRAANGAPLLAVAGHDLLLGAVQDLGSVDLFDEAGGSVPLAWVVLHDTVDPIIRVSGHYAFVFRTRLPAGVTLDRLTQYIAKRSDYASIATVEVHAVDPAAGK